MESKTPAPLTLTSPFTTQESKALLISGDRDPHDPVLRLLAELRDADPQTEAVLRSFKLPESAFHLTREEVLESDSRSAKLAVSILKRIRDTTARATPTRHEIFGILEQVESLQRAQSAALTELRSAIAALNLTAPPKYRCDPCTINFKGPLALAEHQYLHHSGPVPDHYLAAERHDHVLAELQQAT